MTLESAGGAATIGGDRGVPASRTLRRRVAGTPTVLVVFSLGLLYVATRALLLWRFPPYFDESFYAHEAWVAYHIPSQRFISLLDDKGPLLIWLSFVPIKLGFAPLTAVRLVAAASGLWCMVAVGLVTQRFADTRTAVTAMAVFVILPLVVVQTGIGFDEPLLTAAMLSSLYLQMRLAEQARVRDAVLLGITLGAGLLTKETGEIAVVLLPASLLLFPWRSPGRGRRLLRWAGCVLLAVALAYFLYSIERLSPLYYELGSIRKRLALYTPPGQALRHAGAILERNWPGYRVEIDGYLSAPVLVVAAAGLGVLAARRLRFALVLAAWILPPLGAVVLIASRPLGHYLLPPLFLVPVLCAIGVIATADALRRWAPPRRWMRPTATAGLIGLLVLPALWFDVRFVGSPATTRLPSYDDRELITDDAAGGGLPQITAMIRRDSPGSSLRIIAFAGLYTDAVSLLLGDPGAARFPYVSIESSLAPQASFVVATGPLPPSCTVAPASNTIVRAGCSAIPMTRLHRLYSFQRPRGGSTVTLYSVTPAPPAPAAPGLNTGPSGPAATPGRTAPRPRPSAKPHRQRRGPRPLRPGPGSGRR
jgi:hypothetical protein